MNANSATIKHRLNTIRKNIDAIKPLSGGNNAPQSSLIAVSKKQPEKRIEEAINAGIRVFGENRVQEAYSHWHGRKEQYPDIELHLLGPLQSNKAADAVALFDVIHSVDREKIARTLSKEMRQQNRHLPCFIQVNTGNEPQKSGIKTQELPDFLDFCRNEQNLNIIGLMAIPPVEEVPVFHFALLAKWASELELPHVSMGMSGDYEAALRHGATHIRLGTALFGPREII